MVLMDAQNTSEDFPLKGLQKPSSNSAQPGKDKILFASGKSSSYMIKELRRQKLEYEKETGYSLIRRDIGSRF